MRPARALKVWCGDPIYDRGRVARTAGSEAASGGRIGAEVQDVKRKAMYWLFWVVLMGGLMFSLVHSALS